MMFLCIMIPNFARINNQLFEETLEEAKLSYKESDMYKRMFDGLQEGVIVMTENNITFMNELSNKIMSAVVSPNTPADKTGFINRLSTIYWTYDNNRKKLKVWNKNVYLITKCMLLLTIAWYFIFYL